MPIYRYEPREEGAGCDHCRDGFDLAQSLSEPKLECCPACGISIRKAVVGIRVGRSVSCLDDRAKSAGFTKLKRVAKGEYEKQY
jgi:predicted nucleic acid-binding Zn ribbon protein